MSGTPFNVSPVTAAPPIAAVGGLGGGGGSFCGGFLSPAAVPVSHRFHFLFNGAAALVSSPCYSSGCTPPPPVSPHRSHVGDLGRPLHARLSARPGGFSRGCFATTTTTSANTPPFCHPPKQEESVFLNGGARSGWVGTGAPAGFTRGRGRERRRFLFICDLNETNGAAAGSLCVHVLPSRLWLP